MRKPCHRLSYQSCVGRHSRRANETSLNFRKCFFCFTSNLTTGSSTGFPCYFPCSLNHRCLPAPRLLPSGHTVLCGLTSHCCPCVPKEEDACGKGMYLLHHHLGTKHIIWAKTWHRETAVWMQEKAAFPAETMQTSTRGLVGSLVSEIPQT